MSDPTTRIYELRQSVTQASLNFEVWWAFKNSDNGPVFVDTMNRYPIFFQTAINAHFIALLLPLYRIFETRRDTHNLPGLLRLLRAESELDGSLLNEFEVAYKNLKPTWIKVATLRNEVFGHRSIGLDIAQSFAKARLSANQIRDLIADTQQLLNRISAAYEDSYHAFNADSEADTVQLLKDLQQYHEISGR